MHNQCMKYNFNNNNKKSSKIINLPKLLIRIFLTLTIEYSPQKNKNVHIHFKGLHLHGKFTHFSTGGSSFFSRCTFFRFLHQGQEKA